MVEGLLPLIMTAAQTGAAMPPDGVDFIDKNNAGGVLFSLLEEIAHTGGADADKHFDEVGAGD